MAYADLRASASSEARLGGRQPLAHGPAWRDGKGGGSRTV
jgi:hypothetical protein